MHAAWTNRAGTPAIARHPMVCRTAKLACGTALAAALLAGSLVQPVAAQDDTIVLSAGGSELIVSPGNASAISAVAEAHASPGYARVEAAAARAVADCEDGALAQGAAALAVAHPDEGALTEAGAVQEELLARDMAAEIMADNDALAMLGEDGVTASASNQDDDDEIRRVVENKCDSGKDKPEKEAPPVYEEPAPEPEPVQELPATGIGVGSQLASLFAAASVATALGAVSLRGGRREDFGFGEARR
jgi:hypothetical protein